MFFGSVVGHMLTGLVVTGFVGRILVRGNYMSISFKLEVRGGCFVLECRG